MTSRPVNLILPARLLLILACVCALGIGASADIRDAAGSAPHARLVQFAKFSFPIFIAGTPADRNAVYVVERGGRIWIVRNGHRVAHPFLDLRSRVSLAPSNSERGMFSMAFAPDYAKSLAFYVFYSNRHGDSRVVQFRRSKRDPNRVARGSGRTLLAIRHPQINHYGGQLQFGPDGDLYVSLGDGGGVGDPANNAQNLGSLFGKILRIDPSHPGRHHPYRIPKGNPFVHRHGARPEVMAYGLRNPFRFSFGPNGAIWIGDVGENRFEEIDYRKRGRLAGTNFGWSRFEGFSQFSNRAAPGAVFPIIAEAHSGGTSGTHETWCAIIGGYVVQDPSLHGLLGRYLFSDHCKGGIFQTRVSSKGKAFGTGPTGLTVPALVSSFGVDARQHVYVASENGWVYRIVKK